MGEEDMSRRLDMLVRRIDRQPDCTTVALAGDLDCATTGHVRTILEAESRRGPRRLRVDLAAVEFVDASALDVFADLQSRLATQGCTLELVRPVSWIGRIIALTGLQSLLSPDDAAVNGDDPRRAP